MANEHPLYYSDGDKCDQYIFFKYHKAKFAPSNWASSDMFKSWKIIAFITSGGMFQLAWTIAPVS